MNPNNISMAKTLKLVKFTFGILLAVSFVVACTSTNAYAGDKKKKKVDYGQLEISTSPAGRRRSRHFAATA